MLVLHWASKFTDQPEYVLQPLKLRQMPSLGYHFEARARDAFGIATTILGIHKPCI
jgi:hypothetical protein